MNKKNAANSSAVIEIGSNNVRMRVSQLVKGKISTLDSLEYPVDLGHDVFENGAISFESLRELSSVLSKFSSALLSYNIEKPVVVSCTALREAGNRSLVTDQLKVRNGVEVTVLDDSQEKAFIYSEIAKKLEGCKILKKGNSLVAYIGSGSIGIAVFDGAKAIYSQNISMGAVKLHDALWGLRATAEDFYSVVEEYTDTILGRIAVSNFEVQNLIVTGSQIELVAKLCGAKKEENSYTIGTKQLSALYDSIRCMTTENIALRYDITERNAALLYTALFIYRGILRFCPQAETIISPSADLTEAVNRYLLTPKASTEWGSYLRESALACAETTAQRFGCDLEHSHYISAYSCKIFDKMKRIHGLSPSKRLILELASILHSCGSFVSVRQHNKCTFDLIKGMDIFGLSSIEVLEVAFVAGSISDNLSIDENPDFALLSIQERIVVSKLAAIFRMANALDKSHREKLKDLKVSLEEDRVYFTAKASTNTLLEQWAFQESAQFFKDVFGLFPELAIKFDTI